MIRRPLGANIKKKKVSKKEESIKEFILSWNFEFPLDFWWRQQHNTSFNSSFHRESNMLDVLIEVEEFILLRESIKLRKQRSKDNSEMIMSGKWLKQKSKKKSKQDDDFNFDNLDISKL